jgi:pyrroline-5-carboxylate reductase
MTIHSLLLAGGGTMGRALLSNWREVAFDVAVIEPDPANHAALKEAHPGARIYPALQDGLKPTTILLAVKPQQLDAALPAYRAQFGAQPLYLTIAAGKPLAYYAQALGAEARVIRAMPNTPAMVHEGATVFCANAQATQKDCDFAAQLFRGTGLIEWVADEALMDAITALSGSGPAYVFLFLDALITGGVELGLSPELAKALALQTVSGACTLARGNPLSLAELRRNVTSSGGTTEAALSMLMADDALQHLLRDAMRAASSRAKALTGA